MNYIGIDIAKHDHVMGICTENGDHHGKPFDFKNDKEGFEALLERFKELAVSSDDALVGMESTGHYWMALYSFLVDHGFEVIVVNPIQTDALRKMLSIRKTKTDQIDAFVIAEFIRFSGDDFYALSPEDAEGLKRLCRYRMHLVRETTALKNKATAIIDQVFPEYATLFSNVYGRSSKALLKEHVLPDDIATTDVRTLERIIREASKGQFGREKAQEVKSLAKNSIGCSFAAKFLAFELTHIIELIEDIEEDVAFFDEEIARILEQTPGKWLETIPGIGPVLAGQLFAEIGDANRFTEPKKLIAFAGLDASRHQSGGFEGTEEHMSKRGSSYLRWALMQAADKARMNDPYFGDYYDSMKARGKHHYVALSGVARKLAGVILSVLKEQRAYKPTPPAHHLPGHLR